MSDSRSNRIFSGIALLYGLFFDRQRRHYDAVLTGVESALDLPAQASVLDVGCGTGALCSVLNARRFVVTGVDPVRRMLDIAARKLAGASTAKPPVNPVRLVQASVLERLPFADKSFDLAIASYVAHGLSEPDRKIMYAEMSRVARRLVVFHDYNANRSLLTDFAEWLEGGDYFEFIQTAQSEMERSFPSVRVIDVGPHAAWYVCVPGNG
jgi:ubiquinone/menaquinone biosynthesis C-methylase UbiE